MLNTLKSGETIEIDFNGVIALGPSWGDEFISPILKKYKGKVKLLNHSNASVKATLQILKEIREKEEGESKK
ncbi:STAS-like domain-containing protein [Patescibacteria group bacterium]|nr:STAS-like domain-containing protein [Patescibacteria group bacterium]